MKYLQTYNESVRSKMTPVPKEGMFQKFKEMDIQDKRDFLWDELHTTKRTFFGRDGKYLSLAHIDHWTAKDLDDAFGQFYELDPIDESVRDKMTPPPKDRVNNACIKILSEHDNPTSDYDEPEYDEISKILKEPKENLHILTPEDYDDNYESLYDYLESLVINDDNFIRTKNIKNEDNSVYYANFNDVYWKCYPKEKIACLMFDDIVDAQEWLFCKDILVKTNESLRDKMTPRSEESVLKASKKLNAHNKIVYGIQWNNLTLVKKGIEELPEANYSYSSKVQYLIESLQVNLNLEENEIFQYFKSIFDVEQKVYDRLDKLVVKMKFLNKLHDQLQRNKYLDVSECEYNFDSWGSYEFTVTLPHNEDEDSDDTEEYIIGLYIDEEINDDFFVSCDGQDPDTFETSEELEKTLHTSEIWTDEMNESVRHHMTPRPMNEISGSVIDNILRDYTDHTIYFTSKDGLSRDKLSIKHHTGDGFMNSIRKKFGKGIYLHVSDESGDLARKYLYNLEIDYTPIMSTTYKILDGYKIRNLVKKFVEEVINEKLPMIMIRKFTE